MGGIGVLGEAGQPHEGGGGELLLVAAPLLIRRRHGHSRDTGCGASSTWGLNGCRGRRSSPGSRRVSGPWRRPQLFRPPWDGCGERGLEVSLALSEGELLARLKLDGLV